MNAEDAAPQGPPKADERGPLVPRAVVTLVTLVLLGAIVYSATKQDYRSMIVEALVILFILGADLGSMIRGWRGGGQ